MAYLERERKSSGKDKNMRGRRIGQNTIVSIEDIQKIIEFTAKGYTRPAIAKELGFSKSTIYKYQKEYIYE